MNRSKWLALFCLLSAAGCAPIPRTAPPRPLAVPVARPANPVTGMLASRAIAANLRSSPGHRTLAAAVDRAGLAEILSGAGPFTVFAPTDAAFARLPRGTVEALMEPASRPDLVGLLNYHIVAGSKGRAQIAADIAAGGGRATYRTRQGGPLLLSLDGGAIVVIDPNGRRSRIVQADLAQSNGVVHGVDAVLLPES